MKRKVADFLPMKTPILEAFDSTTIIELMNQMQSEFPGETLKLLVKTVST